MKPALATYEVECSACHELRWPRLEARPRSYVCVRCTSVPPEKRLARREVAQARALAIKSKKPRPGERQTTRGAS